LWFLKLQVSHFQLWAARPLNMWHVLIVLCCQASHAIANLRPNIVLLLADDVGKILGFLLPTKISFIGWADVSWNNPHALTPHMLQLARNGLILSRHYAHPVCSPSRAALMTGMYATKTNIQEATLEGHPLGLDMKFTLLPAFLSNLGYQNYAVGK